MRTMMLASIPIALVAAACGGGSKDVAQNSDVTTGASTSDATSSVTTTGGQGGGGGSTTTSGMGGAGGAGGAGGGGAGGAVPDPADLGKGMPQVIKLNSAVLLNPKVMPITYDTDAMRADIEAFIPNYAQSMAWTAQTKEYGVGALTMATPQHIAGGAAAMVMDSQVTAMLDDNLTGANPAWGAPDASTIYAFFFPLGTIVNSDGACCTDFDGYHFDHKVGGVHVPYAVMCQCPGFDGQGVDNLQQLTVVASHEFIEAVTDPFVQSDTAYAQTDDAHAIWTYVTGGEIADMCEYADTAYWNPPDMTYMVQRTWSNKAAAMGHDPCVGEATKPYYQTIPETPDSITIFGGWVTKGTKIAKGATGTVTLDVFADAAAGPFKVYVDDYSSLWLGGPKKLKITQPSGEFQSGDKVTLSVTVLGTDQQVDGGAVFAVTTMPLAKNLPSTYYFGLVGP